MALNPQQIPSRSCGCCDCLIDLPPHRYGERPARNGCAGPWRVQYQDGPRRRAKNFPTRQEAQRFCQALEEVQHGA